MAVGMIKATMTKATDKAEQVPLGGFPEAALGKLSNQNDKEVHAP